MVLLSHRAKLQLVRVYLKGVRVRIEARTRERRRAVLTAARRRGVAVDAQQYVSRLVDTDVPRASAGSDESLRAPLEPQAWWPRDRAVG